MQTEPCQQAMMYLVMCHRDDLQFNQGNSVLV